MTDKQQPEEEAFATLMQIVEDAFSLHYDKDTKPQEPTEVTEVRKDFSAKKPAQYESIEEYTKQTGKRFRMTKRQKELGMTREEAFNLTYGEY